MREKEEKILCACIVERQDAEKGTGGLFRDAAIQVEVADETDDLEKVIWPWDTILALDAFMLFFADFNQTGVSQTKSN